MKLFRHEGETWEFRLGPREKGLLQHLLSFYPLKPDTGPVLSRTDPDSLKDATSLLEEALAEQRIDLGEWSQRRIARGDALQQAGDVWRLTLDGGEIEKLLQVLNELRVGAWTKMGCPDQLEENLLVTDLQRAPLCVIMMAAGQFEMDLLHAMHGRRGGGGSGA